jgi:hypothetical protein
MSRAGNWVPYRKLDSPPSPWLSNQTVQPGPSRFTVETVCFGTGAKTADFSILPDAASRLRMQHRPSSTQSEAEPHFTQRDIRGFGLRVPAGQTFQISS